MMRTLLIAAVLAPTALLAQSTPAPSNTPTAAPARGNAVPRTTYGGVGELNFQSVPLRDVLEQLRERTGANMNVNWNAMEAVGVTKDTPVTVRVKGVTLRKALDLVLRSAAPNRLLTFYVDSGIIEVTTQELADQQLITKLYPIGDILIVPEEFEQVPSIDIAQQQQVSRGGGGGQNPIQSGGRTDPQRLRDDRQKRTDQIVETITSTIRPEVWQQNGGPASIKVFNNNLVVTAPRSVHEQLGGPKEAISVPSLKR